MVQVQSTWFPVYDRNPQTFVPNIFETHAADYVKATQRRDYRQLDPAWQLPSSVNQAMGQPDSA